MEEGLIKITPNKEKAQSILKMVDTTLEMIKVIDIKKFSSNVTKEYYDVIRELLSVILLLDGYKTHGEGAHKKLIEYIQINYKDDPQVKIITGRINTSVEKSTQLVEDLMQFSRKQLETNFQKINLAAEMEEIYRIIQNSFSNKIDVQIDVPESLYVIGDSSGLTQVLMNLCTNARDAMPEGGELRLEARQEGEKAVAIISDNGPGMDRETMEKCFDPFFTTKEVGQGTGLGLSTSYGIIDNHNGEIHVDSQPGKGTVFKVYLPLDSAERS